MVVSGRCQCLGDVSHPSLGNSALSGKAGAGSSLLPAGPVFFTGAFIAPVFLYDFKQGG